MWWTCQRDNNTNRIKNVSSSLPMGLQWMMRKPLGRLQLFILKKHHIAIHVFPYAFVPNSVPNTNSINTRIHFVYILLILFRRICEIYVFCWLHISTAHAALHVLYCSYLLLWNLHITLITRNTYLVIGNAYSILFLNRI